MGYRRADVRHGLAVAALAATVFPACSVKNMAINKLGSALASGTSVYATDDDPELVRDALPFGLKTMEALILQVPENRDLLLAASSGFTQYAYAFVENDAFLVEPEDPDRAAELEARALKLYLRGRDYGLRSLELDRPGILERLQREPDRAAAEFEDPADAPRLFWTAAGWGAAISLGRRQADLVADIDAVRALMRRTLELDEDMDRGAVHGVMISLESLPAAMGGSLERADEHFRRAVELSGGTQAGPYVTWAEAVAVSRQDRAGFRDALERALAIDPDRDPPSRLANLVTQERARALQAREDELFVDSESLDDEN